MESIPAEVPTYGPRPSYPIESVENALRLLSMLGQGGLRVSDAGPALGTAVSTAHRLLGMLHYYGFVEQDPESKIYRVGPALLKLGLAAVAQLDIRRESRPFLADLRDRTGETVSLALPHGDHMLFVDSIECAHPVRVMSRTGQSMWAHCTSVGKAYLALEPDAAVDQLYPSDPLPGLAAESITTRAGLHSVLERVRRDGYARNANESQDGLGSIGVAVRGPSGTALACISVAMPIFRLTKTRQRSIAQAAISVAAELSAHLIEVSNGQFDA